MEQIQTCCTQWSASDMTHADTTLTVKRLWDWFGNAGCLITGGGSYPLAMDGTYTERAMTDKDESPFEKL